MNAGEKERVSEFVIVREEGKLGWCEGVVGVVECAHCVVAMDCRERAT